MTLTAATKTTRGDVGIGLVKWMTVNAMRLPGDDATALVLPIRHRLKVLRVDAPTVRAEGAAPAERVPRMTEMIELHSLRNRTAERFEDQPVSTAA